MTKKKHPANRFERLMTKDKIASGDRRKIKQFGKGSTDRAGHVRRKLELEAETVKEFTDEVLSEQVRH